MNLEERLRLARQGKGVLQNLIDLLTRFWVVHPFVAGIVPNAPVNVRNHVQSEQA